MSGSLKLGVIVIVSVIVIYFGLQILVGLLGRLLTLILPLLFVAGLGLVLYHLLSRKALGGGRRYLP